MEGIFRIRYPLPFPIPSGVSDILFYSVLFYSSCIYNGTCGVASGPVVRDEGTFRRGYFPIPLNVRVTAKWA
jgi:hypothetical protein